MRRREPLHGRFLRGRTRDNAPNAAPCDDGSPCTTDDVCAARKCGGQSLAGCCFADCDCDDANACTVEVCGGALGSSCTVAAGVCGVQGSVRYYRDAAGGGIEPSTKGVPAVRVDRNGDGNADVLTDGAGAYGLLDLSGNLTLTPVPRYGNPRPTPTGPSRRSTPP